MSCFIWSGALDSSDLLLSYHITLLASPMTIILISTLKNLYSSLLQELEAMGLSEKPLVTVWNKMDACTDKRELMAFEAEKRGSTVPMSALTGEGLQDFQTALQVRFV